MYNEYVNVDIWSLVLREFLGMIFFDIIIEENENTKVKHEILHIKHEICFVSELKPHFVVPKSFQFSA